MFSCFLFVCFSQLTLSNEVFLISSSNEAFQGKLPKLFLSDILAFSRLTNVLQVLEITVISLTSLLHMNESICWKQRICLFLPLTNSFPRNKLCPVLYAWSVSICQVQGHNTLFILKDCGEILYRQKYSLIIICLSYEVFSHINEQKQQILIIIWLHFLTKHDT